MHSAPVPADGGRDDSQPGTPPGPDQPGSAQVFPGESASRAAAFGSGLALDVMPDGTFQWTTPSGRQYTTEPTRYPI